MYPRISIYHPTCSPEDLHLPPCDALKHDGGLVQRRQATFGPCFVLPNACQRASHMVIQLCDIELYLPFLDRRMGPVWRTYRNRNDLHHLASSHVSSAPLFRRTRAWPRHVESDQWWSLEVAEDANKVSTAAPSLWVDLLQIHSRELKGAILSTLGERYSYEVSIQRKQPRGRLGYAIIL